tara:strand:- start:334410 stop:335330 length:921 start_codon:yes stop_codon:yes gene_type:complete
MRVLVVCSYNNGAISPFVREQVVSLRKLGVKIDYFKVRGKGVLGYLKNYPAFVSKLKKNKYQLIHAHYGFCGLLSILQMYTPVVCTFHGSDTHNLLERMLSIFVSRFSNYSILTNEKQIKKLLLRKKYSVEKCGIDLKTFVPKNQDECRARMGLNRDNIYILFSSSFSNKIKNPDLARESVEIASKLIDKKVELIPLEGYSKVEVANLINACDLVLVTSRKETGPLIVKEALACNKKVISTNVGDVESLIANIEGCYVVESNSREIAEIIIKDLNQVRNNVNYRMIVEGYSLEQVSERIKYIYESI